MAASIPPKSVETIQWLTEQTDTADVQSKEAVKVAESFAAQIRGNKTPENVAKLHALISESELAIARAGEFRNKLWEAQLAAHKSKAVEPSPSLTLTRTQENTSLTTTTLPTTVTSTPSRWARIRAGTAPTPAFGVAPMPFSHTSTALTQKSVTKLKLSQKQS